MSLETPLEYPAHQIDRHEMGMLRVKVRHAAGCRRSMLLIGILVPACAVPVPDYSESLLHRLTVVRLSLEPIVDAPSLLLCVENPSQVSN